MEASSLATDVSHSGHRYAMTASASSLSPAAMMAETYGGLSQVICIIVQEHPIPKHQYIVFLWPDFGATSKFIENPVLIRISSKFLHVQMYVYMHQKM